MAHWTTTLKAENVALREALEIARQALRSIPQSRLEKARRCPDQDGCCDLAYIRCAEEVDRLGLDAIRRMNDAETNAINR